MPKRILIATGGTGGHVYPAVALAQQFLEDGAEVLFVGGGLSNNRYFDRSAFRFQTVDCGAFTKKSPLSLLKSFSKIAKGLWQSRKIIKAFNPDVAVGFGSYYSFPPLLTAKFLSVPVILHEANSIPGKVNRLLAPYALMTGVHFPQTLNLLKGHRKEVGMPLRKGFQKKQTPLKEAKSYFGLSNEGKILLVFGGSQGSNIINTHVLEAMKTLKDIQVIHIVGDVEQHEILEKNYQEMSIKACVKTFENRMDLAWEAADLVISRAGASSIAEQLEFEVPGILIPFAKAADNHQNHNADFLVNINGAKKIQENALTAQILHEHIQSFFDQNGKTLKEMKASMGEYKLKMRTQDLYGLINYLCFVP